MGITTYACRSCNRNPCGLYTHAARLLCLLVQMVDFKRTKKSIDANAFTFGRTGAGPVSHVPETAFHKYSLQQSMYELMLEQTHGLRCEGGLYLLRMHAEIGTYEMVQCADMKAEAKALLEEEDRRMLRERAPVATEASTAAPSEAEGSTSGKRRRERERPSRKEAAKLPRPALAAPPCSAPPPVAVLAIDIETHGWIDEEHSVGQWTGQFGKSAWRSQRQLEFSRVVQLGIVAFDAAGRLIARRELCVSDAPPCQTQAIFYHHLTDQMLRAKGVPITRVLQCLLHALRGTESAGGMLVSHGLEFDAGTLLEEYRRLQWTEGVELLTRLATRGECTFNMARRLQTVPLAKEKPSLAWTCERVGVALPTARGDSRPHTAAYDAEAHGRLYLRLREMEARGKKLYGHLPAGVAPAADAASEAMYFNCRHQLNERVKALGARWDDGQRLWYVPAGYSLAPFAEWLTRAADATDGPTWFEYDMAAMPDRQAKIKALGGRFDKERRRWYVPAGLSMAPFREYTKLGSAER